MAVLFNSDRNVLILHIPRTGGMSRDKALADHGFRQLIGHVRLCDLQRIKRLDPEIIDKIICIIRHPAERELSQWMFSQSNNPLQGPSHDNVNDYVRDWRTTPLWYYQRAWYRQFYRDEEWNVGNIGQLESVGYYPYWLHIDGVIPPNVCIVKLEEQEQELERLLGIEVEIPTLNDTHHRQWEEYFDETGLTQLQRLYGWSIENYWPTLKVA